MATFAIGDVHGNLRCLERVIALVESEVDAADTVVFLGDYIDRGPFTAECLDLILGFQEACAATVVGLMGNHEAWLLRALNDPTDHCWWLATDASVTIASYSPDAAAEIKRCARAAGLALYEGRVSLPYDVFFGAMPPKHLEFLQWLRTFHRTPDLLCVHGGVDPGGGPVDTQTTMDLLWGTPGFQHRYAGADIIVYGHWGNALHASGGHADPVVIGRTIGIDSIKYGTLTAVKMPDGLVLQSNGSRSWVYSAPQLRGLYPARARRS